MKSDSSGSRNIPMNVTDERSGGWMEGSQLLLPFAGALLKSPAGVTCGPDFDFDLDVSTQADKQLRDPQR